MQTDATPETGWSFVAEGDAVATVIDGLLRLDPEESYSRSELAAETDVSLKTLHLMDAVEDVVALGLLEKHDRDGAEVRYAVNEDSDVLAAAREFDEAVAAAPTPTRE